MPYNQNKNCPLCDRKKASSNHHILPKEQGGSDNSKNIIWLCKKCHDELELSNLLFTPELAVNFRRRNISEGEVSSEEYWYLDRDNGTLFLGIKEPGKDLKEFNIFIPIGSPTLLESGLDLERIDKSVLVKIYNS